jgi:predicted DsbA family dithiol-disulfide isomerase
VGIGRLKSRYELEVTWRAFPLHPETPEDGLTLEELFAGRRIDIPAVLARLKKAAEELGLPWGDRVKTYNSRLAQEMGKWAEGKGKGDQFHDAAFRAYFVEGENISRKAVLTRLAVRAGLAEDEAREILESRRFREAVDEDWRLSAELGINAVPTFVMLGTRLVGVQPYEVMEGFVRRLNVPERKLPAESLP